MAIVKTMYITCDICGKTPENPFEAHMREFTFEFEEIERTPSLIFVRRKSVIKKRRIDICDECYKELFGAEREE